MLRAVLILACALLPGAAGAQAPARPAGPPAAAPTAPPAPQPVTPAGSRIGMVPPAGFAAARSFTGFENPADNNSIVFTELPAEAIVSLRESFNASALARQGIALKASESFAAGALKGTLYRAEQAFAGVAVDKWIFLFPAPGFTGLVTVNAPRHERQGLSDAAVRTALATLRAEGTARVSPREALPFTFKETARFKLDRVLAGNSVLLTDAGHKGGKAEDRALFAMAQSFGGPPIKDRDAFVRGALERTSGIREVKVQKTAAVTVDGMKGTEITAECVNAATGTPCMAFQAVVFEYDQYYRFVGVAPRAESAAALKEFRTLLAGFKRRNP